MDQSKALEGDNVALKDHVDELEEKLDKVESELDEKEKESAEALKHQREKNVKDIEQLGVDLQSSRDELVKLKQTHKDYQAR